MVRIRFYVDPVTGRPHVEGHGINEDEAMEVLSAPLEDGSGRNGARVAIGRTQAGRFLRVVYVPDPGRKGLYVITAYELGAKTLKALRRRMKGRT